ncbi:MAG: type IV secretion system protein [Rickettsiales bacterium]|nr:type IV secretion system protein [Rickettsiales bacterium]
MFAILLASCDGSDCIEADDFGEYDTDLITVDSKNGLCEWKDDDNGGGGSETVADCLMNPVTTIFSFGGLCDVSLNSASCSSMKDCLIDIDNSCLSSFTYTGTDCNIDVSDTSAETIALEKTALEKSYNLCIEQCIENCLTNSFTSESAFETDWVANSPKSDVGGYGISISSSQTVNVQVLGSISLFSALDKTKTFADAVSSKKIQMIPSDSGATYFNSTDNMEPVVSGRWCNNGDVSSCVASYQVGEFGISENIAARFDFLRRGVLMINDLPAGGVLSSDGTYSGPEQEINYDYWKCNYDENNSTTTCATDYPDSPYKSQNDSNYAMNNSFVKIAGGVVIPENVNKFVSNNPFSDIECSTDSSNNRVCNKSSSTENLISTGEVSVSASNVLSSNPYFLGYSGGIRKISISSVYPVKLAFAMIDGNNTSGVDDACTVRVLKDGSTTPNVFSVKSNGKWFFAQDDSQSVVVFNKTQYNTLKSYDTYDQDLSQTNAFNLTAYTDSSQTWKDGDGNDIACGDGMAVFIIPQNEILINKSGFVSFKDLLGDFVYCSGTLPACAGALTPITYSVNFNILNPMYNFRDNVNNIPLLEKNFDEYSTVRTVAVSGGNNWSSDVFVRKGQILRFDENNWFKIDGDSTNGYTIEKRYVKHSDGSNVFYTSVADGLVLRVEARPALLCSGTANENIDNSACTKIYDENGNITCQAKTYSDLCSDDTKTNYCPLGCYCTNGAASDGYNCEGNLANYITSADSSAICLYFAKATATSCDLCQTSIVDTSNTISPTISINVVQCYNLEDYNGAVSNLTNLADTSLYDSNVKIYGELTTNDYLLGARKLSSVFNNDSYGNLDGMTIDTSYKNSDTGEYSEFRYNSPNELSTSNKNISFFVIENSDFDSGFSLNSGTDMYSNNQGEYKFIISPEKYFNNGEQLAVALALKNWNGEESDTLNFKKWVVKYNTDKSSSDYGSLDTVNSPYYFDSNGYIIDSSTGASKISIANLNIQGLNEDEFENLRLYFKIIDKPEEVACGGSNTKAVYSESLCKCASGTQNTSYTSCSNIVCDENVEIENGTVNYCVNSYYNNNGSYTLKLKTPKNVLNSTGYIVKYVMKPILEVIDGKNIGLYINNNKELEACTSPEKSQCNIYFPESEFDPAEVTFGNNCVSGDANCYKNCSNLATDLYKTNCKYFNNGGGFLQRFYVAVITDNAYQIIVKLCFTLMIMFYGMYYMMGMADLTHGELVKRIIKIGFIYLMIGEEGWKYYNMYFVKFFKQGVDYVVFAVAGAFDQSSSLTEAFVKGDFYDKSVLFSGVDKNLSLLFSDPVSYKIWGLFFVSFFGWLYVFIIYSSIFTYIFSVANALLLYLTAQFFLSLLLAFGPIFFILLIFEKTKEMFNKWMNNLISFALEQIFLLTCLSLFNILVYNIIKFILSYRVCWKPVWELNLPLLGSLKIMSFWKATTATSASAAASAIPGLFQILLIYLIADLMSKFIEFSTDLGTSIGGSGVFLKTLSSDIKKAGSNFYNNKIAKPMQGAAKDLATNTGRKLIGYKTAEDEKKEDQNSKVVRNGLSSANIEADKSLAQYKKMHGQELMSMDATKRNETLAAVRSKAFKSYFDGNDALKTAAKGFGITSAEQFASTQDSDYVVSRSLLGALTGGIKIGKKHIPSLRSIPINPKKLASSLLGSRDGRFGAFETAEETERKMKEGKTKDGTYKRIGLPKMGRLMPDALRSEAEKAADYDYRRGKADLKEQYGSNWFSRVYKGTNSEYKDAKRKLKEDRIDERTSLGQLERRDQDLPESASSTPSEVSSAPSLASSDSEVRSVPGSSSESSEIPKSSEAPVVSSESPVSSGAPVSSSVKSSDTNAVSSAPSSLEALVSEAPKEASKEVSREAPSLEALVSEAPEEDLEETPVSKEPTEEPSGEPSAE